MAWHRNRPSCAVRVPPATHEFQRWRRNRRVGERAGPPRPGLRSRARPRAVRRARLVPAPLTSVLSGLWQPTDPAPGPGPWPLLSATDARDRCRAGPPGRPPCERRGRVAGGRPAGGPPADEGYGDWPYARVLRGLCGSRMNRTSRTTTPSVALDTTIKAHPLQHGVATLHADPPTNVAIFRGRLTHDRSNDATCSPVGRDRHNRTRLRKARSIIIESNKQPAWTAERADDRPLRRATRSFRSSTQR
jgi:hypothetical protein